MDTINRISTSIVVFEAVLFAALALYFAWAYSTNRLTVKKTGEGDDRVISLRLTSNPQDQEDELDNEEPSI